MSISTRYTMKNLIVLFAIVPFLLGASCKDETVQPDIAFACKINGKDWRPYSNDFKLKATVCHLINNGETLHITAIHSTTHEDIGILVSTPGQLIKKQTYRLNSDRFFVGTYDKSVSGGEFITGNGYEGTVEIKNINHTDKSIEGSFHFKALNAATLEVVTITEGQFNLKYVTY